ncbi:hypothetical protein T05_16433 [Trichinella murrelli]|uniref:Uncharacterized protein n=1 Tax=Trichinella murrelli TaxID=144512 RepID=A0A0V0U1I1_9BILA|nr:hypothetical protein T05_16433 [Trichinella murrelli]
MRHTADLEVFEFAEVHFPPTLFAFAFPLNMMDLR